jgi:DNA-binding protein HU-beta
MARTVCRWKSGPFGSDREILGKRFAGIRSGCGLQKELSTNTLIFQHSPAVASETLDGRGSADTFEPGPQNTGPQKIPNHMNKAELIESVAAEAKISKADAKRALDAFVNNTHKALKKGDRVALVGFGTFSVTQRKARKGRNPQTGKEIKIAAKKVVKFKAGAELAKKLK